MYDFLRAFVDLFFAPLYAMSLDNHIYVVIYVVVITLIIWSFVRRLLHCISGCM